MFTLGSICSWGMTKIRSIAKLYKTLLYLCIYYNEYSKRCKKINGLWHVLTFKFLIITFPFFPYFCLLCQNWVSFVTYSTYFIIWLLLLSRLRYDFSHEWHLHGASQGFINSCVVRICTRGTVFVCFKRYFVDLQVFSLLLKVCFYYIWH